MVSAKNAIISFLAMVFYCAPLSNSPERSVDLPHPGMKKISSAGKTFEQGWNGSSASLDEKPGMASLFTYDYWIDTTEVTQKHYSEMMGRRPVVDSTAYGAGDEYPVYNVSWFDAVLFCNARSRAEGLDTVYFYSGIKALPNGTVYELVGLRFDITRDGYRLPTEAEWEYAARGGTSVLPYNSAADSSYASYYAWFSKNSSGRTRVVGTRLPNSLGLYDMAGNVFEWTNDWKGYYNGKSISNSLGALQPDGENEKVIKGGSYNFGLMHLRPSHRSTTYATTLSSANEYVGFRCARGRITKGEYIGVSQSDFSPNPVSIRTSAGDFRPFIRATESELVFVNVTGMNRTLCYVDFGRTLPYPREYLDDKSVYMPTISPDGRYVAYCSSNEGQSGPSEVTIRSLDSLNSPKVKLGSNPAYIPRWWRDPSTGDRFIIYTNSAVSNGNEALWKTTKTYLQKIQGGKPEGAPEELAGDGSYHDGLSADRQYLVTGYNRLMARDLTMNRERQLFLSPANGKNATGSTQVCNVSISLDTGSAVRCMFLDFGYPGTSTVTGSSYGIHQYLFVSTMTDSITNHMRCPDGEQSWDNTEWSNRAQFAVGCGRDGADNAHAIYAIDLDNKGFRQIVTGVELQQPYLWLGTLKDTYSDSLGQYNDPDLGHGYLASKLLLFWKYVDSLEVVMLGSSVAISGFNVRKFSEFKAFNLAAPSADLLTQKQIICKYLLMHSSSIQFICSSLDMGWLNYPNGDFTWGNGVGTSKGYIYDSIHQFWVNGITKDFYETMCQIPVPFPCDTSGKHPGDCRGYFSSGIGDWGPNPPFIYLGAWCTWCPVDTNWRKSLDTIRMLADTLRIKKIHWIIVNFPVSPYYKSCAAYGPFGPPTWQTAHDIIHNLQELDTTNEFFHFYDANMDGNHDYGSQDFGDGIHLSYLGADKISTRVDSILHAIPR